MITNCSGKDIEGIILACKKAGVTHLKMGELEISFTHLTEKPVVTDNYYTRTSKGAIETTPETESLELSEADLDLIINPSKFEDEVETVP